MILTTKYEIKDVLFALHKSKIVSFEVTSLEAHSDGKITYYGYIKISDLPTTDFISKYETECFTSRQNLIDLL
jgi:transcription initiation factor IIE alpha subunit